MKKSRIIESCFMLLFFSLSLSLFLDSQDSIFAATQKPASSTGQKKSSAKQIIITGQIVNIAQARPYLENNSYLALCDPKQIYGIQTSDGSITFKDPGFPKTSFSQEGRFRFELDSLSPGQYIILMTNVKDPPPGNFNIAYIVEKTETQIKEIKINYPSEGGPYKQDLKKVWVATPWKLF
jgi:hypothetical protein